MYIIFYYIKSFMLTKADFIWAKYKKEKLKTFIL